VVYTVPGLKQSILLTDIQKDKDYKPIGGAKVVLAFDKGGEKPVAGFEAESDGSGEYHIDTTNIPAPQIGDEYYLIVSKEGFAPITQGVTIGSFSRYQRNTALLKPLADMD